MKTLLRRPGFGAFLFAQAQVAFNDNATKLILIGIVQWLLTATEASRLVSVISLLLVATFLLFAPLTGWLADRYARRHVMRRQWNEINTAGQTLRQSTAAAVNGRVNTTVSATRVAWVSKESG